METAMHFTFRFRDKILEIFGDKYLNLLEEIPYDYPNLHTMSCLLILFWKHSQTLISSSFKNTPGYLLGLSLALLTKKRISRHSKLF